MNSHALVNYCIFSFWFAWLDLYWFLAERQQDYLINIQEISSTHFAFAALSSDGHVVTWGDPLYGGHCDAQDELYDVQQITGSYGAFHALRLDGWIISWGNADSGGAVRCSTQVFQKGGG